MACEWGYHYTSKEQTIRGEQKDGVHKFGIVGLAARVGAKYELGSSTKIETITNFNGERIGTQQQTCGTMGHNTRHGWWEDWVRMKGKTVGRKHNDRPNWLEEHSEKFVWTKRR